MSYAFVDFDGNRTGHVNVLLLAGLCLLSEARTEYLQCQSQSWKSYLKNIARLGYRIHGTLKEARRLHEQVQVVLSSIGLIRLNVYL